MKIAVIDNYDSFTFNLVHAIRKLGYHDLDVFRNDRVDLDHLARYDKIVLSPGPGIPSEAGLLLAVIERFASSRSMLGVCLGHQAIGQVFGAGLVNLPEVYHGVAAPTRVIARDPLFDGLPAEFETGRYHSWVVDRQGFPAELEVTAEDDNGHIMAFVHRRYDVRGVQFHPESVLTPDGEKMIENFLKI